MCFVPLLSVQHEKLKEGEASSASDLFLLEEGLPSVYLVQCTPTHR